MTAVEGILERLASTRGIVAVAAFDEHGAHVASAGKVEVTTQLQVAAARAGATDTGDWIARLKAALADRSSVLSVRPLKSGTLVVLTDPKLDLNESGAAFHIEVAVRVISMRTPRPSTSAPDALESELARSVLTPPATPKA